MLKQLMPQLEAIPGVRAVSPVVAVPFSGVAGWDGKAGGRRPVTEEAAANPMLNMEVVAPVTSRLGVPVLRGALSRIRIARTLRPSLSSVSRLRSTTGQGTILSGSG